MNEHFDLTYKDVYKRQVQHLLVGLFAVFRFVDAYQFHFGEFVQAVQATYVYSVCL